MTISERIFEILKEKGMSQKEFSELTNIGQSTISDWKRYGTNPSSDKILPICKALHIDPEELLSGKESNSRKNRRRDYYIIERNSDEGELVRNYNELDPSQRQRLLGYLYSLLEMKRQENTK